MEKNIKKLTLLQSDMAVSIALAILLVVFSFGIILVVKYIGKRESVYA